MAEPVRQRIEVVSRLGTGGMGEVFLARIGEAADEQVVALKRIRTDLLAQAEVNAHFEREARICSALEHPNIVSIVAWGLDELGPYLALEYVEGCSAAALIRMARVRGVSLPLPVALRVAGDAALGLECAHRRTPPVVHRDVSPDNILVSRSGVAKLSDFGIAKVVGATSLTTTGEVKGKVGYLPPELFEGHDATPASDVFSLGVTLYVLVTGVKPFEGKCDADLMRAVLGSEPVPPRLLRADVPAQLDALVLGCLAKQPSERPSAAEVATALADRESGSDARARAALAVAVEQVLALQPASSAVAPGFAGEKVITAPHTVAASRGGAVRRDPRSHGWRVGAAVAAAAVAALGATVGFGVWPKREPVAVAELSQVPVSDPPRAGASQARPAESAGEREPGGSAVRQDPARGPAPSPAPPPATATADSAATPSPSPAVAGAAADSAAVPPPAPAVAAAAVSTAAPARASEPAKTSRRGKALLTVKVAPWGHVFVDGLLKGTTPLSPLSLESGRHAILVVNPRSQLRRTETVVLRPGEHKQLKFVLEP